MNALHPFSALLLPLAAIYPWLALKNMKLWGGELDSSVSRVNLIHNCSMALTMYSIHENTMNVVHEVCDNEYFYLIEYLLSAIVL